MSELALDQATVAELRAVVAAVAFPDAFWIIRSMRVPDGRGGWTTTEAYVEAGMGRLDTTGLQPEERETAGRLGWTQAYAFELPYATVLKPADKLFVAGRRMEVAGVSKGGAFSVSARALVKEVG